ncbi:MtrAB system histidine kinase MtrB [Arsenicicoccus sp. oral taxon 190]|uniref:MtrAB system histidine kinase MtrB n=1 Tax=Arsenicicoccus sp. oral taxon 190 TaxID=1658671 RepID=UPI0009E26CB4|nr:MtrAB system histidine kinase MtrB [Arsenicicoccus sp. oral taxon 190]
MARTLKSDLVALRGRTARLGGRVLARSWPWLRSSVTRVVELWRRSLMLRTVTSTMLLSTAMMLIVGSYLHGRVADGLTDEKLSTAANDAAVRVSAAQTRFDHADKTDDTNLRVMASDVVQQDMAPDRSRDVLLTPTVGNTRAPLPTVASGDLALGEVPSGLREQVKADAKHQQLQVVTLRRDGGELPTVLVGAQVKLPPGVGDYDLYYAYPMRAEAKALDIVTRNLLLAGVLLVVLIGGVAFVVTRLVVEPVRRAAQVAERLASGRLDQRMSVRGTDDIAVLGRSFNRMASSLQTQIVQLEGLSKVQQQFVSDVSHELRTPLTTVRMAADVLYDARDGFASPAAARSAELLTGQLERFENLLTDLLEISRIDAGAASLEAVPVDLVELAEGVVDDAAALADRRGSEVTVRGPGHAVVVGADRRRLTRILRNLVVNAIEHGEGRPIVVDIARNADAAAVAVRDNGVGLRPGEASMVFTRFWRADPARARTTGGTGLGLSISLEDAHLHHGWLEAWGQPGLGSCFRLTVPIVFGTDFTESPLAMQPPGMRVNPPVQRHPSEADVLDPVPGTSLGAGTLAMVPEELRAQPPHKDESGVNQP